MTPPPPPRPPVERAEAVPTLADFDQPLSPRARKAYTQALKISRSAQWGDSLRAEMGVLAALHLADTDQRRDAAEAIRTACRLYRLTSCQKLLDQYKDAR